MPPRVWDKYKTHLMANHPVYEKWNRKSGLAYLFPLIVFFGFAIAATMQSSASLASTLAILMFPAAFAAILIVHQAWIIEHGLPNNLGVNPSS